MLPIHDHASTNIGCRHSHRLVYYSSRWRLILLLNFDYVDIVDKEFQGKTIRVQVSVRKTAVTNKDNGVCVCVCVCVCDNTNIAEYNAI